MELQAKSPLVVKFLDFNRELLGEPESLSITLKSSNEQFSLSLGQSKEISTNSLDLSVILDNKVLGNTNSIEISENYDEWVQIDGISSIRLSVTSREKPKKVLKLKGIQPIDKSKCRYLRKIQEIETGEGEVQLEMNQFRFKVPEEYMFVVQNSPIMSPRRGKNNGKGNDCGMAKADYEFPSFFNAELENISENEPDLLQNIAIGLLTQVKHFQMKVKEYETYQETIVDYDYFIKTLGDSLNETRDQCIHENISAEHKELMILSQIPPIEAEILEVQANIDSLLLEISKVREECTIKTTENSTWKKENIEKEVEKTVADRKTLDIYLEEIESIEKKLEKNTEIFVKSFPEQELSKVVNEKVLALAGLQQAINERDLALQESISLQCDLLGTEGLLEIQSDVSTQKNAYFLESTNFARFSKETQNIFSDLSKEKSEAIAQSNALKESYQSSTAKLNSLLSTQSTAYNSLIASMEVPEKDLKKSLTLYQVSKSSTKVLEPRTQILHSFEKKYPIACEINSNLLLELSKISDFFLKQSEQSLIAHRSFRQISFNIETQNLKYKSMEKLIGMIKSTNPVYVPIKNDSVDVALAKYLNDKHNNLEVKFKRIEKQVYNFGSLQIKIDEKFNVLANGISMNIEEFLNAYTQAEKSKVFSRSNSIKSPVKVGKNSAKSIEELLKSTS